MNDLSFWRNHPSRILEKSATEFARILAVGGAYNRITFGESMLKGSVNWLEFHSFHKDLFNIDMGG